MHRIGYELEMQNFCLDVLNGKNYNRQHYIILHNIIE